MKRFGYERAMRTDAAPVDAGAADTGTADCQQQKCFPAFVQCAGVSPP